VLSEEAQQRIRAAVRAERGEAVGQDQELASEPEQRTSGPGRTDVVSPGNDGANGAIESEHTVPPVESGRTAEPAAPERTGPPTQSKHRVKPVESVKPEPAAEPEPIGLASANRKPVAVPRADRPRRPRAVEPKQQVHQRFVAARLVGSALAVIAAVSLAIAMTRYFTSSPAEIKVSSAALPLQDAPVSKQAATWVAQQVSRDANVSCDRAMCDVLTADGFPARKLHVLGSKSPYARTSAVLVETAAVRDLLGTSLNDYAPAVLATFGSGDSQITIRVIAPHGATAYYKALAADLAGRQASGAALAQGNFLTVSATARSQLIAGQVDSRLMLAIAALATKDPINVVQFGNIGPGADTYMPLRYADLAENDPAAHLSVSAYVQSVRADLETGPAGYRPASITTVALAGGQSVLRIEFTAPSPLGLLSPQGSQ